MTTGYMPKKLPALNIRAGSSSMRSEQYIFVVLMRDALFLPGRFSQKVLVCFGISAIEEGHTLAAGAGVIWTEGGLGRSLRGWQ